MKIERDWLVSKIKGYKSTMELETIPSMKDLPDTFEELFLYLHKENKCKSIIVTIYELGGHITKINNYVTTSILNCEYYGDTINILDLNKIPSVIEIVSKINNLIKTIPISSIVSISMEEVEKEMNWNDFWMNISDDKKKEYSEFYKNKGKNMLIRRMYLSEHNS